LQLALKPVAEISQSSVSSVGMWTPTKLVCGVLVLAMHWSVLSFIAQRLKEPPIVTQTPQTALRVRWILPIAGTVQIHGANTVSVVSHPSKKIAGSSSREGPLTDEANPLSKQADPVVEKDPGWNPLNYRTSQEVDSRAVPVMDWLINRESTPRKSLATVIVTVWVSAAGDIDHFQIEAQEPEGDWTLAALSSLQATAMNPATLAGEPVPSTMTLEISLDNTNNEPGNN